MNTSIAMGENEHIMGADGRNRRARVAKQGSKKHLTSVLTKNASGDILPLQLIVEGRLELKHWYDQLLISVVKNSSLLCYVTTYS